MLPRALLIALAAAALYAVVLVTTGSVELTPSRVAPLSGGPFVTMAVEPLVAAPSTDQPPDALDPVQTVESLAAIATPSPEPTPPAPAEMPPEASEAAPDVGSPDPPAPAPDVPASSDAGAAGEAGAPAGGGDAAGAPAADGDGTPVGDAPNMAAGDGGALEPRGPREKTRRARGHANTEARVGEIQRSARKVRERSRRAGAGAGAGAGGSLAIGAPAYWSSAFLAGTPIAIPDFVIDEFGIPPFLLPIYQAAGMEYGVRWEVLAAINGIETDYGRNLNVSSAGARGWMQFMPATWAMYGVDANRDGVSDPNNPVDAIFAAARYLQAAGADTDLRAAIFAYNHANWYVDSVLARAAAIGRLPSDLVDSLAGLAGGRFPIAARATYAVEQDASAAGRRSSGARRSIEIFSRAGARVVAVNDGRVVGAGHGKRLGRFVRLRDVYGNTYTYAHLGRAAGKPVEQGARVTAGATLARLGRRADASQPHVRFAIRPAGRAAPRIDPKPILDGWRLLESTAIHRAKLSHPRPGAGTPTVGEIALMSKDALTRRVLADPDVDIYGCGRSDIGAGVIDRRVLATLEFLAASGLAPTVSSLRCGHGYLTASGNVSEHSTGSAVDISAINGVPITGHQGAGSITDSTIQRLLTLQGAMKPHQIISLMTFEGADNTFAMGDHADHIHVGFRPVSGTGPAWRPSSLLEPHQWARLVERIAAIDRPVVRRAESE